MPKSGVRVGKKWYSYFVVTDGGEEAADTATEGSKPPPAPQRVPEVVPGAEADTTFPATVGGAIELGAVYDAAKIAAPTHGYTVLKVAEMLHSEHIRTSPADVKRRSIMVALDAAGVNVTEIVEDAVRRDRALDTYERVLRKSPDDLRAATAAENKRIEDEIAHRTSELRARIDANNERTRSEEAEFLAWQTRKRQEEETIADAVSYFVSENPITTTRVAKEQGGADVR
jgi:hypothetical protein